MNIFVIFLLLIISVLFFKVKISIYFKFDNFNSYLKVKIGAKEFERNGTLVMRKKKYIVKKEITKIIEKKVISKEDLILFFKSLEIEKLNINVLVGVILLFPTIFSVPILATLFEYIKTIPLKKLKNFNYCILPVYDNLKFFLEVDTVIKVRIFDLIKLGGKIIRDAKI